MPFLFFGVDFRNRRGVYKSRPKLRTPHSFNIGGPIVTLLLLLYSTVTCRLWTALVWEKGLHSCGKK